MMGRPREQYRLADAFGKLSREERRVLVHALHDYMGQLTPSQYPFPFAKGMTDALSEFYNNE